MHVSWDTAALWCWTYPACWSHSSCNTTCGTQAWACLSLLKLHNRHTHTDRTGSDRQHRLHFWERQILQLWSDVRRKEFWQWYSIATTLAQLFFLQLAFTILGYLKTICRSWFNYDTQLTYKAITEFKVSYLIHTIRRFGWQTAHKLSHWDQDTFCSALQRRMGQHNSCVSFNGRELTLTC